MVAFNVLRERLEREHDITLSCAWQQDTPAGKLEHYLIIGQNAQIREMMIVHTPSGYSVYFPQQTIKIDDDIAAIIGKADEGA